MQCVTRFLEVQLRACKNFQGAMKKMHKGRQRMFLLRNIMFLLTPQKRNPQSSVIMDHRPHESRKKEILTSLFYPQSPWQQGVMMRHIYKLWATMLWWAAIIQVPNYCFESLLEFTTTTCRQLLNQEGTKQISGWGWIK